MLYRVGFQIAYGGFFFSESFDDYRDAKNLREAVNRLTNSGIRFLGIEVSDDGGETWEPEGYEPQNDDEKDAHSPGTWWING